MKRLFVSLLLLPLALCVSASERVATVTVSELDQLAYFPQGSAPATTVSLNNATLSARLQSTIEQIPVRVADIVSKGDLLVQLDCRNAKASRDSARASHALAQYQLQRATTLNKGKHVSEELLRTRESELAIARSLLTAATIDVERCQVKAPFNGVITQRIASIGEWVNRGEPLLVLVDLDNLEVSAKIPDALINELQNVNTYTFASNEEQYAVQPRSISSAVDPISRTREVRLSFTQQRAQPGQSGRLVWQSAQRYLPAEYLVKRAQGYGVFILAEDRAKFVPVPQAQEGRPFRVDLAGDVRLIVNGRYTVQDGDAVMLMQ